MTGTAFLIALAAIGLLLAGLVYTLGGFHSRRKDPEHRRRPGDRFRPS